MDATATSDTYRFGSFRLQARGGRLSRLDGRGSWMDLAIGSRALDLLLLLLRRHGEILSRDEIMDAVWPGFSVEESNLTVQMAALRRILDQVGSGPELHPNDLRTRLSFPADGDNGSGSRRSPPTPPWWSTRPCRIPGGASRSWCCHSRISVTTPTRIIWWVPSPPILLPTCHVWGAPSSLRMHLLELTRPG